MLPLEPTIQQTNWTASAAHDILAWDCEHVPAGFELIFNYEYEPKRNNSHG